MKVMQNLINDYQLKNIKPEIDEKPPFLLNYGIPFWELFFYIWNWSEVFHSKYNKRKVRNNHTVRLTQTK
jgi:hypothetical protein